MIGCDRFQIVDLGTAVNAWIRFGNAYVGHDSNLNKIMGQPKASVFSSFFK